MKPLMREIVRAAAQHFDIALGDVMGTSRARRFCRPRQTAMYLCRELRGSSLPEIGEFFRRDHTTIMNACCWVEGELAARPAPTVVVDLMVMAAIASEMSVARQERERDWVQSLHMAQTWKPIPGPARKIMVPERYVRRPPARPPVVLPSSLAPISRARLMGARA